MSVRTNHINIVAWIAKRKHLNARNAVHYKNKKSAENKAIISTSSVQSNGNGAVSGIDKSDSCVTANVGDKKRKRSKYAYLYCTDCEEKPLNEICVECMKKYNRVKSNNSYKKLKPSKENILLIQTNVLSYISPFYHNFENLSFFNISTIFRPPVQGVKPQNFVK